MFLGSVFELRHFSYSIYIGNNAWRISHSPLYRALTLVRSPNWRIVIRQMTNENLYMVKTSLSTVVIVNVLSVFCYMNVFGRFYWKTLIKNCVFSALAPLQNKYILTPEAFLEKFFLGLVGLEWNVIKNTREKFCLVRGSNTLH